jgi:hypothetical protein
MKKATIPYVENFLTEAEADELFDFCRTLPSVRPVNPRNPKAFIRKVSHGCFSILPESRTGKTVHGGGADGFAASPQQIKDLAGKLTEYAGKTVNYLSVLGYENEKDHIGFHRHREDDTLKSQAVYVVSLGEERLLTIRPAGSRDRSTYQGLLPKHGSLYVLPHLDQYGGIFNQTHEHAILDEKFPCSLRISINCKAIDDEYLLKPNAYGVPPPPNTFVRPDGPPRIWCQRKGCQYPADAVNVDRYTIFGNHKHLQGDEWLAWCAEKMSHPYFAAKVRELKGKDLLCWCRPEEESGCHAREWLRLANAETQ